MGQDQISAEQIDFKEEILPYESEQPQISRRVKGLRDKKKVKCVKHNCWTIF